MRNEYKLLVRKRECKRHSEDVGLDWRIILKWILERYDFRLWIGLIWLWIGITGGLL
jgi:hypothetical protein